VGKGEDEKKKVVWVTGREDFEDAGPRVRSIEKRNTVGPKGGPWRDLVDLKKKVGRGGRVV